MGKLDLGPALDRLYHVRLIVLEARAMGLDEQDEEVRRREVQGHRAPRHDQGGGDGRLVRRGLGGEGLRRGGARVEAQVPPLREGGGREGHAKALTAGKSFDELAKKAVADKKAKGEEREASPPASCTAPCRRRSPSSGRGATTAAPVKVPEGFAIVRVEDVRVGNDPGVRAKLEQLSREANVGRALHAHPRRSPRSTPRWTRRS